MLIRNIYKFCIIFVIMTENNNSEIPEMNLNSKYSEKKQIIPEENIKAQKEIEKTYKKYAK